MNIEIGGKKCEVPDCFVAGFLDSSEGLVPFCRKDDCQIWERCLSGGRVGETGVLEVEGEDSRIRDGQSF